MLFLAKKYDVSPAVLLSRFVMGLGIVSLSNSLSRGQLVNASEWGEEHMKEDLSARGVSLEEEDAEIIDALLEWRAVPLPPETDDWRSAVGTQEGKKEAEKDRDMADD